MHQGLTAPALNYQTRAPAARSLRAGLTRLRNPLMMNRLASGARRLAAAGTGTASGSPRIALVAPSFNGRTADSGSAYRGSNPWGAASITDRKNVLEGFLR